MRWAPWRRPPTTSSTVSPMAPPIRRRLTQALADLPGTSSVLADLTNDEDQVVAMTATSILARRG